MISVPEVPAMCNMFPQAPVLLVLQFVAVHSAFACVSFVSFGLALCRECLCCGLQQSCQHSLVCVLSKVSTDQHVIEVEAVCCLS